MNGPRPTTYRRLAFLNERTGDLMLGDDDAVYNTRSREIAESSLKHCLRDPALTICTIEIKVVGR